MIDRADYWYYIHIQLFFVGSSMLNYSPENAENLKIIFEKLKLSEALRPYKHLFIGDLKMANLLSGNYFLFVVL